jgi:hypothetical protein
LTRLIARARLDFTSPAAKQWTSSARWLTSDKSKSFELIYDASKYRCLNCCKFFRERQTFETHLDRHFNLSLRQTVDSMNCQQFVSKEDFTNVSFNFQVVAAAHQPDFAHSTHKFIAKVDSHVFTDSMLKSPCRCALCFEPLSITWIQSRNDWFFVETVSFARQQSNEESSSFIHKKCFDSIN